MKNPIIPPRLSIGSHLAVVAPSRSASVLSDDTIQTATKALTDYGFQLSFADNWLSTHEPLQVGSVKERLDDLHSAFRDPSIAGVITAVGGYNSNQLLSGIDYELIQNNPKVICGLSDITAIVNAIYAKTGLVTYLGPHFSSWGNKIGFEYSRDMFTQATMTTDAYSLTHRTEWSDDKWYLDQGNRKFHKDTGGLSINKGSARGIAIGGNIDAFCNLLGTPYAPTLKNAILFLEQGNDDTNFADFDAQLQSILDQPGASEIKAIMIGRFCGENAPTDADICSAIRSRKQLDAIPVVANLGFGHTTPIFTVVIGGEYVINVNTSITIEVISH